MPRHVPQALHDDHMATMAVLEALEARLGRNPADRPPDLTSVDVSNLLKTLVRAIEAEIGPHFAFEEEFLFPRLAEAGDREMADYLIEEHRAILPLAHGLLGLVRASRESGFGRATWAEFHAAGAEFVERLISHIQKEEMGLLPALDDILDDESDSALALEFAARR